MATRDCSLGSDVACLLRGRDPLLARLWAEHFPKSKESGVSKTLCMAIALILEDKAQAFATDEDLIDTLHHLLERFGIPKDQFYELEKEFGDV
jgi:hypothetical protein